jgi:hypothetical protein
MRRVREEVETFKVGNAVPFLELGQVSSLSGWVAAQIQDLRWFYF